MKNKVIKISAALITVIASIVIYPSRCSNKIDLHITAKNDVVKFLDGVQVEVVLTNKDNEVIRLVSYGDGSDEAWRTPIVMWNIQPVNISHTYFSQKDVDCIPRSCGNRNALKWGEVFHLFSNQIRTFSMFVDKSTFLNPGTYKISMVYINNPNQDWEGRPLGFDNLFEMLFVRYSTQCQIGSNEITVTVVK